MKHISKGREDTERIAEEFLSTLGVDTGATVVGLSGDLGSGKTNFAQTLGRLLGVEGNMASPTFVLEKIYDLPRGHRVSTWRKLIHIDAYRIEREEELLHLGWEEVIKNPENLVLIEWPERVSGIMPRHAYQISFQFIDEETREITYA